MSEKIDGRKTEEFRESARARGVEQFASPAKRAAHSELTREKMSDPAVRERIRAGMARAAERELASLREAWRRAPQKVREQFLAEIAVATVAARA
jgi:hypothetical protein